MTTTPHINPDFAKGARLGDAVELAASLGVCKNTVWNHVGARRIPAVRLGSVVRFHLPSVLRALGVKQVITALLLLLATSGHASRHSVASWWCSRCGRLWTFETGFRWSGTVCGGLGAMNGERVEAGCFVLF